MKTLEDLKALREKLKNDIKVRQNSTTKIIIGMGTCGIAAGAREVMKAVLDELAVRHLTDVQVPADRLHRHVRKRSAGGCCAARRTAHYLRQSKTGRCKKNYCRTRS